MSLGTFQAVKFGGCKGGPRASAATVASSGVEAGCRALEDGSDKEGGAGRQQRPYSYHRHSFESATHKTGGGYSDEFCEYPPLKLRFGGNGTSQLLVPKLRDEETGTS